MLGTQHKVHIEEVYYRLIKPNTSLLAFHSVMSREMHRYVKSAIHCLLTGSSAEGSADTSLNVQSVVLFKNCSLLKQIQNLQKKLNITH